MAGNTSSNTISIFHPWRKAAAMDATRLTPAPAISQIRDVVALNDDDILDNILRIKSVKFSLI
jgi:hypothetical protein